MLGGSGRHFPVRPAEHLAGPDVRRINRRRRAGQRAPAIDENLLAEGVVDPGLPVVGEQPVFAKDALGDLLGQIGAEHLEFVLLADALVPTAEEEAGIIDVMVEMVVGEEEVIHLCGKQSRLDQLVRRRRPAVEHQVLVSQFEHVGTPETGGRGRGCPGAQSVDFSHLRPRNLRVFGLGACAEYHACRLPVSYTSLTCLGDGRASPRLHRGSGATIPSLLGTNL